MVGDKVSAANVAKFVTAVTSLNSSTGTQPDEAEQAELLNQMASSKDGETSGAAKQKTTRSR